MVLCSPKVLLSDTKEWARNITCQRQYLKGMRAMGRACIVRKLVESSLSRRWSNFQCEAPAE